MPSQKPAGEGVNGEKLGSPPQFEEGSRSVLFSEKEGHPLPRTHCLCRSWTHPGRDEARLRVAHIVFVPLISPRPRPVEVLQIRVAARKRIVSRRVVLHDGVPGGRTNTEVKDSDPRPLVVIGRVVCHGVIGGTSTWAQKTTS